MDNKLSERHVCTKYITPALEHSGWDIHKQIREEVSFTDERIVYKNKGFTRKKGNRADYILYYKPNIPLAIIEAKDIEHSIGSGMQQALDYAEILDIPFVFSSNGKGFLFHDRTGNNENLEQELTMNQFPSPEDLWQLYKMAEHIDKEKEKVITEDYYQDGSGKSPRYYQRVAINRTIEAIAKGQDRILLVMATGTGKTYTAFQIIWRLWKARKKKRILFLADRNILVDQAKSIDFKPFRDKVTKLKNRTVDKSYEIYMALYQGISGSEEDKNIYKQFSPDFFDLVVVDECHRGSVAEDSAWREILQYFSNATHIGTTRGEKGLLTYKIDEEVSLRLFNEGDAEEFYNLTIGSKPYLKQWLGWLDYIESVEDSANNIKARLKGFVENGGYPKSFAIIYRGEIAGTIGFNNLNNANRIGVIGYWLGERFQGKGIMSKAFKAVIDYGFKELELNRIEVSVAVENKRSRALPERFGFTREGEIRQAEWLYDHYVDHIIYGLLSEEWK